MTYKGYRLEPAEMKFPYNIAVSGIGIYEGEQLLTMTASVPLAKKLIDQRLKMGVWKGKKI